MKGQRALPQQQKFFHHSRKARGKNHDHNLEREKLRVEREPPLASQDLPKR